MDQSLTVAGPVQSDVDEFDDIEQELSCSSREASVGYVPFAGLDLLRFVMETRRTSAPPPKAPYRRR